MQMAVRDALIGFMAATAQAQAEAIKEAQSAGIQYAKSLGKFKGRKPSYTRSQIEEVLAQHALQASASSIAMATGLSRQTVYRIIDNPERARIQLDAWER